VRTTVTLDPDTEALVRKRMNERGVGFKTALNDLVRESVQSAAARVPFRTVTKAMGKPRINLDKALQIAAELEDEELIRKMRRGA